MFLRIRTTFLFCLLGLAGVAGPLGVSAWAQSQPAGATVRGNVVDPDNALIPGALVTLTPASGKALTATSQSDGTYTFRGVPPGTYSLTATANGFATFVRLSMRITTGQALTQDIKMTLQEQSQVVQVTANTAQVSVDADSNASSTVIKEKDLDALSDDPDELNSELLALAGPAAGPNGGQIYVDGFTGGQLPPKSSIREIRINQNPFSAQYDRIGFGRVEVFTKPGTDKFHGSASLQGNDNTFNTSNPYLGSSNALNPYHTIFFFGQLTGPLSKRASFTVGGSRRSIQDNSIVNPASFYSNAAGSTALCGPGDLTCTNTGGYPSTARAIFQPRLRWDVAPRVDFAISEKNTLVTRFQYESNNTQNDGLGTNSLPTTAYNSGSTEAEIQISDSQIVSSKVVNETRFEFNRSTSDQTAQNISPTLNVQGNFTGGGSSQGNSTNHGDHIEVQNYTSIALAKNFIRFGGRMRYNNETLTSNAGSNGTFTYSYLLDPCVSGDSTGNKPANCAPSPTPCAAANQTAANYFSSYQCGLPSQYSITTINQATITGKTTDVGLYVEDDWKPKGNLSISYGLRYEAQTVINSAHDFAPRLSLSYGIPRKTGNPLTVVRAGFGIFYDRFGLGNILNTFQNNGLNQITSTYRNPGALCQPGNTTSCGTASAGSLATIQTIAPNFRSSYNMQGGVGVDQQLSRSATLSVNFLHTAGRHQFFSRSLPTATNYDYEYGSGGVFNQDQLTANFNVRQRRVTMFGFYALSFAHADTNGAGFFLTNPNDPHQDYGRAGFNRKNIAVFGGNITLPYKFSASPFMIAQSGNPYNVTTGTDLNGNSIFNDRPGFVSGSRGNCLVSTSFVSTGSFTPIPINYCTAPGNFTLNMRLARTFGFGPKTGADAATQRGGNGPQGGFGGPGGGRGAPGGGRGGPGGGFGGGNSGRRYNLTLGAQGSNVFNAVPRGTPVGQLTSTRFGQTINIAGGPFSSGSAVRRIQLQATFNF